MKLARVENNLIVNIEKHKGGGAVPPGLVDVTGSRASIGDPIVDGVHMPRPSKYHTVEGSGWALPSNYQDLLRHHISTRLEHRGAGNAVNVTPVMQSTLRRIEKDKPNAYKGYIRFNKVKYLMDSTQVVLFIEALEEYSIEISDFKDDRLDELDTLSVDELENYDIDGLAWPVSPIPDDYVNV